MLVLAGPCALEENHPLPPPSRRASTQGEVKTSSNEAAIAPLATLEDPPQDILVLKYRLGN